uniref:Uncharacterized protein n=1 Tax=Peronospora matthiolae TaxID=2874970 RepID=A0AAV1UZ00_9STRA
MCHPAHLMEPYTEPRAAVAGLERASSILGEDLEVKMEKMPRSTEKPLVSLLSGLAERMAKL